jgi:hypothetical protein
MASLSDEGPETASTASAGLSSLLDGRAGALLALWEHDEPGSTHGRDLSRDMALLPR